MHELAITKSLLKAAREACVENNILKAKQIIIELGLLTSYKKEPLIHYFNALKPNSKSLVSAELVVNEIPGKILCNECKKISDVADIALINCQSCESFDIEIVEGNDIKINSIIENE